MASEPPRKIVVKQPGRDVRIRFAPATKAAAKKAAPAKKAAAKKAAPAKKAAAKKAAKKSLAQ